jgi:hypothetical protein
MARAGETCVPNTPRTLSLLLLLLPPPLPLQDTATTGPATAAPSVTFPATSHTPCIGAAAVAAAATAAAGYGYNRTSNRCVICHIPCHLTLPYIAAAAAAAAAATAAAGYGYNRTSNSCTICRKGFFGTGLTNSTGTVTVPGQPTQVPCQACPANTTTARPQTATARACVTPFGQQSVRVAATGAGGIDFSRFG